MFLDINIGLYNKFKKVVSNGGLFLLLLANNIEGMKQIFYLILTVLLLGGMFVSNPNEEKFKTFLITNAAQEVVTEGRLLDGLKDLVGGGPESQPKITTDRANYYLLSVYDVKGGEKNKKYLGAFGTFFELSND